MKHITSISKAVCTLANHLLSEGLCKSAAFRKAWQTVKGGAFRVAGTTFNGGQNKLAYLQSFKPDDIKVALQREKDNEYDKNAVAVWVKIESVNRMAKVGHVPHNLAVKLSKIMDKGVKVIGKFGGVIGGYGCKENLGLLINMAI